MRVLRLLKMAARGTGGGVKTTMRRNFFLLTGFVMAGDGQHKNKMALSQRKQFLSESAFSIHYSASQLSESRIH
jgi:hypothetical protein